MLVPTRSTTHDYSSCSDTRNFRKLGFYSLQFGLRKSRYDVWSLVCNLIISDKRIDSSSRFRLALFFEKAIVKARNSILILSQYNPLSLTCSFFFVNIGILNVNSSTKLVSDNKELLNFQNSGPRGSSLSLKDTKRSTAE